MKPRIDATSFGSITVAGKTYRYDVIIRASGEVEKRRKKLSKELYGTSHRISQREVEHVYEEGTRECVIGSGQNDSARLSDEAASFLTIRGCTPKVQPTSEAIEYWNNHAQEDAIGLFHVTC